MSIQINLKNLPQYLNIGLISMAAVEIGRNAE
jgi:hypothetical protein